MDRLRELERENRRLRKKLERATANLARHEDYRERSRAQLQHVIVEMQETEDALVRKNDALEAAREELEQSRLQALDASAAKTRFLANMSHELRTPLNAVIGYTEMLIEDPDTRRLADHELSAILSASRHLLGVIGAILDITKIEAGHVAVEPRQMELQSVLDELDATIRPLAEAAQLSFAIEGLDLPACVHGDPGRLLQVLVNLASNAVKFTPSGRVQVHAQHDGERCTFVVADTGIGMTAAQLEYVFDPFVQADASTTRRFGGTGLGLAITRDLVQAMDGRIDVSSEPGVGTTFVLVLPMPTLSPVA